MKKYKYLFMLLFLVFMTVSCLSVPTVCFESTEEMGNEIKTSTPKFTPTNTATAQKEEETKEENTEFMHIVQTPTPVRKTIDIQDYEDKNVLLIIEKLEIEVPIKVAEVYETKEGYVFTDSHDYPQWIPEWSKEIGQFGISIIYGHRQWGVEPKIFSKINELEPGDEILIINDKDEFTFIVSESIIITDPSMVWEEIGEKEVDVIENNQSVIALLTCTPWGTDWNRLVVFGILDEGVENDLP